MREKFIFVSAEPGFALTVMPFFLTCFYLSHRLFYYDVRQLDLGGLGVFQPSFQSVA